MTKTLLIDKLKLNRELLNRYLDDSPLEISVAQQTDNGLSGYHLCREVSFDLVLTDLRLPSFGGYELVELLLELPQAPSLVVIAELENADFPYLEALGVQGVVDKNASLPELSKALTHVAAGKSYFVPANSQKMDLPRGNHVLTLAERTVLRLMMEGKGTQQIARDLQWSLRKVESLRDGLIHAFEARDAASMIAAAIQRNVLRW